MGRIHLALICMGLTLGACIGKDKRDVPPVETPPADDTSDDDPPDDVVEEPTVPARYLYVASGACYGGGVAVSAASNTIVRYNLSDGSFDDLVVDYNTLGLGDSPSELANFNADNLVVLIENGAGRRLDLLDKQRLTSIPYLFNTNLNGVMRDVKVLDDGSVLVSKTSAVELFTSGKARVTNGVNAFITVSNTPANNCNTSAGIYSALKLPGGKFLYINSAAGANKLALVAAQGWVSGSDCLATVLPAGLPILSTGNPTHMVRHTSGDVLVSLGSTTNTSNGVYSFRVNETANTIAAGIAAYNTFTVTMGPSAMAVDPETGDVFVANAVSSMNNIEKFTYNSTTQKLTRVGSTPFIPTSVYTRCISGMAVGN